MADVKGVGKDEPITTNEQGGMQSRVLYGFHLCDPRAMLALAEVMQIGAEKYARDNWRKIPCEEHINHAMIHYWAYLAGDTSDDHLEHALARAMMAVATKEKPPGGG
jgi:hypothetical protein